MIFVFLFLTYFTLCNRRSVHPPRFSYRNSFLLVTERYPVVCTYRSLLTCSPVSGCRGCSRALAVVSSAAVNTGGTCAFLNYGFLRVYAQ